jgi:hypothetical protein
MRIGLNSGLPPKGGTAKMRPAEPRPTASAVQIDLLEVEKVAFRGCTRAGRQDVVPSHRHNN